MNSHYVVNALAKASLLILIAGDASATGFGQSKQAIFGGMEAEACEWPAVVTLGECSGALVHPEVILLAAHCLRETPSQAIFGRRRNTPDRIVAVARCQSHPEFNSTPDGHDIGFCLLSEPVTDVPYVPLLEASNESLVAAGLEAQVVGFGVADNGGPGGIKRSVSLPVTGLANGEAELGGQGLDSCVGDSGGPAMLRLADGSWRIFGVVSTGEGMCGLGGDYTLTTPHLSWLEDNTERPVARLAAGIDCPCAPTDDVAAECCGQKTCEPPQDGCRGVALETKAGWLLLAVFLGRRRRLHARRTVARIPGLT